MSKAGEGRGSFPYCSSRGYVGEGKVVGVCVRSKFTALDGSGGGGWKRLILGSFLFVFRNEGNRTPSSTVACCDHP